MHDGNAERECLKHRHPETNIEVGVHEGRSMIEDNRQIVVAERAQATNTFGADLLRSHKLGNCFVARFWADEEQRNIVVKLVKSTDKVIDSAVWLQPADGQQKSQWQVEFVGAFIHIVGDAQARTCRTANHTNTVTKIRNTFELLGDGVAGNDNRVSVLFCALEHRASPTCLAASQGFWPSPRDRVVHGYDDLITAVEPIMAAKRSEQAG